MSAVLNDSQLNATVFVPNDDAISKVTAANNITVGDLYNNPLDVLTLVSRMLLRTLLLTTCIRCAHAFHDRLR